METPTWPSLISAWLATIALLLLLSYSVHRRKVNLLPDPKPWPIIGNLNLIGLLPHRSIVRGNELNPSIKLAAQIVLGLLIVIITLLALLRFQQAESVLELISQVLGTLDRIVVLLQRLINDLHQIISMAEEGFQQVLSVLERIHNVAGSLVNFVVLLLLLLRICRRI